MKTAWSRPAEKGLFPVLHECSRLHRGHKCTHRFDVGCNSQIYCKHCHACQRASQKPQSHCVRTAQQKCPEPAGGTCQALRRRRTPHFLSLPRGGRRVGAKRMRTQSVGSVLLLLHKKQSVVAQEAYGVTKAEGMWRGAPSPSFVLCELFGEKAAGPACFIANASVTSKGPQRSLIRGCTLHLLTSDPRGGL